ncbi:Hypothetical protein BRZCDTV_333 [Brazilian cedratvirus IHUMI]|uniref:Uncharacterized protein n=1 Tax=Brazilian cedratvirus IHUMI TaxID=2126980 RepID=A0A2R8FEK8_9VIRU|nr:Hypothetical protein BRZCDTV_333 [Brazilian cedratvirus IHUMI]
MKSLRSLVLAKYSYDELKELCLDPSFNLLFDCQWDIWRDKAAADFGISHQFFDLMRIVYDLRGLETPFSGSQRYLQISTYVKITPLSLASGCTEGVYEVWAAFVEARQRKDKEAMLWIADCMTPEQEKLVNLSFEIKRAMDSWAEEEVFCYPPLCDRYDLEYLCLVIIHGRVDILDQIIHKYFSLPKGFSIEKNIPKIPFWEFDKEKTIHDLPLQTTSWFAVVEIIHACLSSSDARIVDFFRSIFRDSDLQRLVAGSDFSRRSLLAHGKPEEAYNMALRFIDEKTLPRQLSYMSELVLSLPEQSEHDYTYLVTRRLGNLTFITSILPFLTKDDVKEILELCEENEHVLYPLSVSLLEEYLKKL